MRRWDNLTAEEYELFNTLQDKGNFQTLWLYPTKLDCDFELWEFKCAREARFKLWLWNETSSHDLLLTWAEFCAWRLENNI